MVAVAGTGGTSQHPFCFMVTDPFRPLPAMMILRVGDGAGSDASVVRALLGINVAVGRVEVRIHGAACVASILPDVAPGCSSWCWWSVGWSTRRVLGGNWKPWRDGTRKSAVAMMVLSPAYSFRYCKQMVSGAKSFWMSLSCLRASMYTHVTWSLSQCWELEVPMALRSVSCRYAR